MEKEEIKNNQNNEQEDNKKDKKKKHKKLILILILILCSILILLIGVYLLFYFTHKDQNRNTHIDNKLTTSEIINRNLINGFNETKTTGKYSFRISTDDINQILLNETKDLLCDKELNMYAGEPSEGSQNFYIDFKKTLGMETRINITLTQKSLEGYLKTYEITSLRMGKLPYLNSHIDRAQFIEQFSKRSRLPISYDKEANKYLVSPLDLLDYFPDDVVVSTFKELIELKPECVSLDNSSLFGFDIDLSKFKSSIVPNKEISDTFEDFETQIRESVTSEFLSDISIGESKIATRLLVKDVNKHLKIEPDLINRYIYIEDIYVSLKDSNHFTFVIVVSFNGYNLYFEDLSELHVFPNMVMFKTVVGSNISLGDIKLSKESFIRNEVMSEFKDFLKGYDEKYSYVKYISSSLSLSFDFQSIMNSIPDFDECDGTLLISQSEPNGFDLEITRV